MPTRPLNGAICHLCDDHPRDIRELANLPEIHPIFSDFPQDDLLGELVSIDEVDSLAMDARRPRKCSRRAHHAANSSSTGVAHKSPT